MSTSGSEYPGHCGFFDMRSSGPKARPGLIYDFGGSLRVGETEERLGQTRLARVRQGGAAVRRRKPVAPQQHVRFAGEDVREGEIILASGTPIRPYEINMLAAFGQTRVTVVRRPRVAIVATGDELVPLGEIPLIGQIVNSNSYSLAAAITSTSPHRRSCRHRLRSSSFSRRTAIAATQTRGGSPGSTKSCPPTGSCGMTY